MNQSANDNLQQSHKKTSTTKRVVSGSVLVAREELQDPNFEATVVLVCISNDEGSYGLVINRIAHMPLSEIFDGMNTLPMTREIFIGGPVEQDELQILHITDTPVEQAHTIAPEIFLGGDWEELHQMIDSDPSTTRIFLGYSGWGPDQLQSEIDIGAWDVYNVDIKQLLLNCNSLAGADRTAIHSFLTSISC